MELKSIVLILIGMLLLSIGILNVLGYVQLEITPPQDFTPPDFLYTYPQANTMYRATEIDELVAYVQDMESEVSTVSYSDTYNQQIYLTPTLHKNIKHQLTIYFDNLECKFPDVDLDTKVTKADLTAITKHYGALIGDPNYSSVYDVVPDGKIEGKDVQLASKYYGTAVFKQTIQAVYSPGNVTFSFVAVNSINLVSDYSGTFQVANYQYLTGIWYINNIPINSSSTMHLEAYKIVISFNCTEKIVSDTAISVEATVNGVTYKLPKIASYYWQSSEIDLKQGNNNVKLLAYITEYRNEITVTIETPKSPTLTLGHMLIIIGALCIISGVLVEYKKKHEVWYS